MKRHFLLLALGTIALMGGCRSQEPVKAYANPVDACASIEDEDDRARCLRNIVADAEMLSKRESQSRTRPPR
jgi:hypothetical protein